jgi:hypothetical protein
MVLVTLLKLSIVEQLRPKAVLNSVVFVLDEVSKEEERDFACNLPGINRNGGVACLRRDRLGRAKVYFH